MKAWLGASLRIVLDYALALLLFSMTSALWADSAAPSFIGLAYGTLSAARAGFPYALALALAFGTAEFRRARVSRLAAWVGLILAALLACGGGYLGRRGLAPELLPPVEASYLPPEGVFFDVGSTSIAVLSFAGKEARGVIAADFAKPLGEFGSWTAVAPLEGSSLRLGGASFPLSPPAVEGSAGILASFMEFSGRRLGALDRLGKPEALLALAGFAILCAGFASPGLRARWPLGGLVLALTGLSAALAFDLAAASGAGSALLEGLSTRFGLGLGPELDLAAAEGAAGLLVGAVVVLLPSGKRP